jgi:sugar lactone lactonase YvrE
VGADAAGRVYVLDGAYGGRVQRFAASGEVEQIYDQIPGSGCMEMVVAATGDFYCISTYGGVYRVSTSGDTQPIADDPAQPGYLQNPRQLAVAPDDSLWAYDLSSSLVNHYSPQGVYLSSFPLDTSVVALTASNDRLLVLTNTPTPQVVTYDWSGHRLDAWGTPAVFRFDHPDRLAAAPDGTLYVLERGRRRIQHLDGEGNILAVFGTGLAAQGNLTAPQEITVDVLGRLYVLDESFSTRVIRFADDHYDATFPVIMFFSSYATVTTIATTGDTLLILNDRGSVLRTDLDGIRLGEWSRPESQSGYMDMAVTAWGRAYLLNRHYTPQVRATTLLGTPLFSWGQSGVPDIGPGKFVLPAGIVTDLRGRLFVVDTDNRNTPGYTPTYSSRVQVFDEQGQYLTDWGSFGSNDGQFANPQSIAALPDGRIVVADTENNRLQVFAPEGSLPEYTPLPAPTSYDTPLPPISTAWQDRGPVGGSAPYTLAFPPAVTPEHPIVARYADGRLATSTDGVHWTRLPGWFPDRLVDVLYAGSDTLIARADRINAPYRSTDQGHTWTRLGDAVAGGPLTIAPSPTFDADGILFASAYGSGFWRSTDRGESWELRSLAGLNLDRLAVAANADRTRTLLITDYSGASRLLRSTDDGLTWQPTGQSAAHAIALSPAFAQDQTVFALQSYKFEGGILRSTDGGVSWERLGTDSLPGGGSWAGLAISPDYLTDRTLVAWSSLQAYLSTDAGHTWATFGPQAVSRLHLVAFSPTYAQDHRIWRSEEGPGDRFTVTTDGGLSWQVAGDGMPGVMVRSGDLGQTWQAVGGPLAGLDVIGLASRMETGSSVLYAATSAHGIWRSEDRGHTWTAFNAGLPNGHGCALAQATDLLAVGLCDGGVYVWQPGLAGWQRLGDRLPARINGLLLQRGRTDGTIWAATAGGIYRTTVPAPELMLRALLPLLVSQQ